MFTNPEITQEEKTKSQVIELNAMVNRTVGICTSLTEKMFNLFWKNPNCTPMQMSEMYGTEAVALFVKLATWQAVLQQINPDYVPLVVPAGYEYVINEDGSVTITAVEVEPVVEPEVTEVDNSNG